jgi:AcrR family transcriptional regulator
MANALGEARRRPGAEDTRRRLLEAGRRAFATRGLAGTNLRDDILEPAGISVGSFYHQFGDKTELLLAILHAYGESFRERLHELHAPRPGKSSSDLARSSYALLLDIAERDEDLVRIQILARNTEDPRVKAFERENRERWRSSLAEDYRRIAAVSGIEIEAELLAELIVGLSLGVVAQYLELPPAERPAARERFLDGLVRFTLGGASALSRPGAPTSTPPTDTQE